MKQQLWVLYNNNVYQGVFTSYQRASIYSRYRKLENPKWKKLQINPSKYNSNQLISMAFRKRKRALIKNISENNPILKSLKGSKR